MTTTTAPATSRPYWQAQPHRLVPEHVKPRPCAYATRAEYRAALRAYEQAHLNDIAVLAAASAHAGMREILIIRG